MANQTDLLFRIRQATDIRALQVLRQLGDAEISLINATPAEVTVGQATNVWRVRYNSSLKKGRPLEGAEAFLSNLTALRPQRKLEQFTFSAADVHGNLFFEKRDRAFIGAIFVHEPSRSLQKS